MTTTWPRLAALALVTTLAACGATAPAVGPAADPAPAADEVGLARVDDPGARALAADWLAATREDGRAWRVLEADGYVNATELFLVERVDADGACEERYAKVLVDQDAGRVDDLEELGADCCGGACVRDGVGWMIHLWKAQAADDRQALAARIDPAGDLKVEVTTIIADDFSHVVRVVTRDVVAEAGLPEIAAPHPLHVSVGCDAIDADGSFSCSAGAGGLRQEWTWRGGEGGPFLVRVTEEGD